MKLSIIIPCYNEEEVLNKLFDILQRTIINLKIDDIDDYEVIFINDGSADRTKELLRGAIIENDKYKAIHFSRNFGHQAALLAGLKYASGDAAFILDADLQDPPDLLQRFIEKYKEGYDVVYGIRKNRKEGMIMKSLYFLYYRLLKIISDIEIPLDSGDFCLISRRTINLIVSLPEKNKFIRGLRSWAGFKQTGIEYERRARIAGRPKYNFRKLFKLSSDGIFGFSKLPLKLAFWLGIIISVGCLLGGVIYLVLFFILDFHKFLPGYTSMMLSILFLGGIQLFFIGLLGEYIGRIYDGVNNRPNYIIESKDNF